MSITSVTSKGQVTIPLAVRKALGIRQGSRLSFRLLDGKAELRVEQPAPKEASGFGMVKAKGRKPVAADFDAASLLKR